MQAKEEIIDELFKKLNVVIKEREKQAKINQRIVLSIITILITLAVFIECYLIWSMMK
jgi:hypothetical protein